jgi:hypothetical protein
MKIADPSVSVFRKHRPFSRRRHLGHSSFSTSLDGACCRTGVRRVISATNALLHRGTATFDGMAIAHGTLQHLVAATRCLCLFATHYHVLAREFEDANPFVALFHMACGIDEETRVSAQMSMPETLNEITVSPRRWSHFCTDFSLELATDRTGSMSLVWPDLPIPSSCRFGA